MTILRKNLFCVYQAHVFHSMNSTLYIYIYHYFAVNVTSLPANCWLKESLCLGQWTSMTIEPDTVKCTRAVLWSMWSQSILNEYNVSWSPCKNMPLRLTALVLEAFLFTKAELVLFVGKDLASMAMHFLCFASSTMHAHLHFLNPYTWNILKLSLCLWTTMSELADNTCSADGS